MSMDAIARLNAALEGRYRIERQLGEGGMATVYLADDLRHERKVALKVLKPELAAVVGAERFLAEIKTTANLQHPHILPLFDSGEAHGFLFYVMPFIESEGLAERLGREKQLPIEDAIRLGTEIGDALDYAHRRGVIHRDIKPANVLLQDGRALVADFGIAIAVTAAGGSRLTETGLSLGTPAYMSPEQATGDRQVDGRTDIYALGCLLYEMLTGQPPHLATTAQAVLAKVLTSDPEPISQHRETVPRHVEAAIHKAMARLPADRFGGAAELSSALTRPSAQPWAAHTPAETLTGRFPARGAFAALAVFAFGMTVAAVWGWTRTPSTPGVRHVAIPLPAGLTFLPDGYVPALSPEGSTVVFAARAADSTMLYRRPIDGFEAEPIEGTDDAEYAFFSPDGEWLAFFTRLPHEMKKVPLSGGDPILITPLNAFRNDAVWMSDGSIVFSWERQGLWTVSADGGRPTQLTQPDGSAGEVEHVRPQELPDGRLFFAIETEASLRSAVLDLGTGERELLPGDLGGIYDPGGIMIVPIGDTWRAQRFGLRTGEVGPTRVSVLQGAPSAQRQHKRPLSLSRTGDMAYFYGTEDVAWIITAIDTLGASTPLHPDAGRFRWPRASPDGRTLLIGDTNDERLWTLDLVTRAFRPFPVEERWPGEPTWSADGRRIAYTIEVGGDRPFATIYARNADGTGSAQVLAAPPFDAWTSSWSPDGRYLAFYGGLEQLDIWVQDLERDTLHQVTSARSAERHPDFSPDGRWIAYQSDESGRNEIWVRGFPDFERRYPISIDGGTEPIWATNGRELFFRNGSQIMVVEYATEPTFSSGPPRELLRTFLEDDVNGDVSYSVMPDDRTFVIVRSDPRSSPELRVIKDWVSDVKRRTRR